MFGSEIKKVVLILATLGDKQLAASGPATHAPSPDFRARENRWGQACRVEQVSKQRGRRCLAVCTSNRNPDAIRHQTADRLAQGKLGQLASRRFHTFRIVTRNRRTVDEHIGRFRQVCCVVTLIDSQPLLVQPPKEVLRDPLIRPSDAAAKPVHQLSKSLHPGAADPHQVSRADACSSYLG